MIFDLQARLAGKNVNPEADAAPDLVGCLCDECLSWAQKGSKNKNKAQKHYQERAGHLNGLSLPTELNLDAPPQALRPGWLAVQVDFKLTRPWYSRDDRPFHVLDNPLRKDPVFGVPFMAASSWKGLLRWACRMEDGLFGHLEKHDGAMTGWQDPAWTPHLFGNEKGVGEELTQGALHCRPSWFNKIGFEVINPHDRSRRAGAETGPVTYEVAPAGTEGRLDLLYAPRPGAADPEAIKHLLGATEKLITQWGFSAKRTAGWGVAKITEWQAGDKTETELEKLKAALPQLLGTAEGAE